MVDSESLRYLDGTCIFDLVARQVQVQESGGSCLGFQHFHERLGAFVRNLVHFQNKHLQVLGGLGIIRNLDAVAVRHSTLLKMQFIQRTTQILIEPFVVGIFEGVRLQ